MCLIHHRMSKKMEELSPMDDSGQGDGSGDSEEDDEPKICQVCGDKSTGYHFNAMTCEGCKGFFRRAMKKPTKFCCPFQNACVITKSNRRQCQSCRLQKCLSIGMKQELIMSDEAVEKRRLQIRRKRVQEEPVMLTPQQEAVIQELLTAHQKTFDMTCAHFIQFRPLDRDLKGISNNNQEQNNRKYSQTMRKAEADISAFRLFSTSPPISSRSQAVETKEVKQLSSSIFTSLPHFTDLTTYTIKNVINFGKALTMFRALNIEDQISLLKGATFEIILIHFNMFFNEETNIWECGPLQYCMDDAFRAGFQSHLLDPMMNFHCTLRKLHLHEEEYVLMQAISLFSPDRPGVTHHKVIDSNQETLALTLKTYIEAKRTEPEKHLLYPKIIGCLTEMRTMNEEYTKQVLKIQDIQPDISPLLLEIISKNS
ncbi:nuclear receptor subfamily 1 group I member 2 isoform X2 [Triplophysa dalaica]|uniref:nuclear receptor subfamily 1 group I member 2 isoform X2 n=1 Tax=Triplophysa dalaica TaxID=1582913 RepID=UPI0024DF5471|nr:nuclear receptor subfamily 1 group I member 2 isoform X2 [Triplophysa dalaica]